MSDKRFLGFQIPQHSASNVGSGASVAAYDVVAAREPVPDMLVEQIRQAISQDQANPVESLSDWLDD